MRFVIIFRKTIFKDNRPKESVWCAFWRANHTPEVVMHYAVKKSECELCFSAVSHLEVEDPDVAAT